MIHQSISIHKWHDENIMKHGIVWKCVLACHVRPKQVTHSLFLYTFSEGDKILLRPSVCVEFWESLGQAAWAENEED